MKHLKLTPVQIQAIQLPRTNSIIFDKSLGYSVIYDGTMWVKFITTQLTKHKNNY